MDSVLLGLIFSQAAVFAGYAIVQLNFNKKMLSKIKEKNYSQHKLNKFSYTEIQELKAEESKNSKKMNSLEEAVKLLSERLDATQQVINNDLIIDLDKENMREEIAMLNKRVDGLNPLLREIHKIFFSKLEVSNSKTEKKANQKKKSPKKKKL